MERFGIQDDDVVTVLPPPNTDAVDDVVDELQHVLPSGQIPPPRSKEHCFQASTAVTSLFTLMIRIIKSEIRTNIILFVIDTNCNDDRRDNNNNDDDIIIISSIFDFDLIKKQARSNIYLVILDSFTSYDNKNKNIFERSDNIFLRRLISHKKHELSSWRC